MEVDRIGDLAKEDEECYRTPKKACSNRIPLVCPPAPRKKRVAAGDQLRRPPPHKTYFNPPDLELLFASLPPRN